MREAQSRNKLLDGREKLDPVLRPLGYFFGISENGSSSGGAFAAGFYKNGDKKIGLIYRSSVGLGAVIYEYGQWGIGHDKLMRYFGKQDVSKLGYKPNRYSSYSKGGGDVFDALVYDIQNFGIGFLTSSDEQFEDTIKKIREIPEPEDTSGRIRWIVAGVILLIILLWRLIISFQ